jgi:DNA-3-methyladenine glycosylase
LTSLAGTEQQVASGTGDFELLGDDFRSDLVADPVVVAPRLLGLVLVTHCGGRELTLTAGRIVEVEAYRGAADPASHAFRGQSARNRTMFGRAGLLYVYLSYGVHFCCNIVCGPEKTAAAVLVRALEPLAGIDTMRERRRARPGWKVRDLCSGPGKLAQALGIDRADDGADLLSNAARVRLVADGDSRRPPAAISSGPRIGIAQSLPTAREPWRFFLTGNPHVSRGQPSGQLAPERLSRSHASKAQATAS